MAVGEMQRPPDPLAAPGIALFDTDIMSLLRCELNVS